MKALHKIVALLTVIFTAINAFAKLPTYSITEALHKNLITLKIAGADSSLPNSSNYYGKCMQIEIKNTSVQYFKIKLNSGQQFIPNDTSKQNMMVTQGMLFAFRPGTHKKEYINAMCVQKNDGAPTAQINFTIGNMSKGHLLSIAQLVEKHKYFNSTAQNAVWCISDGSDISTINGNDSTMVSILQQFVSKATGQKIPSYHQRTHRKIKRYSTNTVTFEWGTSKEYNTTLVVLNTSNQPVKEVFKNKLLPQGHHSYEILLSTADLPKGYYKVILYVNNRITMQRRVRLGR